MAIKAGQLITGLASGGAGGSGSWKSGCELGELVGVGTAGKALGELVGVGTPE